MAKEKIKKKEGKKEYFFIAIGIFIIIFSLLILGRIGYMKNIYLYISFIFGDFTFLVLVFLIVFSICNLIINKPIDIHHIYFIGGTFIFLGMSMFCHLGLYDPLSMTNTTIFTKTIKLYKNYIKIYEETYTVGGGIISAVICQLVGFVSGKIGIILVSISFLIIGGSYLFDVNVLKLIKGGRIRDYFNDLINNILSYFKGIHTPLEKKMDVKIPISTLMDKEGCSSFSLQEEINNEKYKEMVDFIHNKRITCMPKGYMTSYTSSRFIVSLPHKSDNVRVELTGFFNKCCFVIKNNLEIKIEVSNQFKKLLTLKNVLLGEELNNNIILGVEVDGSKMIFETKNGSTLLLIGDYGSGLKTMARCILASFLIKGINLSNIYFYDLYQEFQILDKTKMYYMNNERSVSIALDEAFSEYERRMDTLKYLNVDSICEANNKIREMGNDYELMMPLYHILFFRPESFDEILIQKLNYVIQFGLRVGIVLFIFARNKNQLNRLNLNNSDILSFYQADISSSIKMFGGDIASRLQKKGDILFQTDNKLFHGQAPYISLDDFEKIISKL